MTSRRRNFTDASESVTCSRKIVKRDESIFPAQIFPIFPDRSKLAGTGATSEILCAKKKNFTKEVLVYVSKRNEHNCIDIVV